jgi:hypothetical protein
MALRRPPVGGRRGRVRHGQGDPQRRVLLSASPDSLSSRRWRIVVQPGIERPVAGTRERNRRDGERPSSVLVLSDEFRVDLEWCHRGRGGRGGAVPAGRVVGPGDGGAADHRHREGATVPVMGPPIHPLRISASWPGRAGMSPGGDVSGYERMVRPRSGSNQDLDKAWESSGSCMGCPLRSRRRQPGMGLYIAFRTGLWGLGCPVDGGEAAPGEPSQATQLSRRVPGRRPRVRPLCRELLYGHSGAW